MSGIDQYTVLMLHMQGANGGTTFIDASASAHAVTVVGNAQTDTSTFHFPNSSAKLIASNDYLSLASSADWNFGSGDFTIDGWINLSSFGFGSPIPITFTIDHSFFTNGFFFRLTASGAFQFLVNSTAFLYQANTPAVLSLNTWTHWAVVRSGGAFSIFVNGVLQSLTVDFDTLGAGAMPTSTTPLSIGAQDLQANSHQQEFRISKGIARWTANFSVPLQQYDTYSGFNLNRLDDLHLRPNRMIAG